MKKIISSVLSAIGLFTAQLAQGQGTLYVSNLGQTPIGSATVGSDSWLAQGFFTGTNSGGYVLDSVQLLMNAASGNPSNFNVSIYNQSGSAPFSPMNSVGSLSGFDPSTGGLFTYTTSGIILSPSTLYFVVATAATPIATGAYNWSAAQNAPAQSQSMWGLDNVYFNSTDGSNWNFSRSYLFQLGIYATAVPEPSELALGALGALLLCFHRWCNSSR